MGKRKSKFLSLILALCMVVASMPLASFANIANVADAASRAMYYTVEKYDADGNGTMMVAPTSTMNWSGRYGTTFIKSLLGDNVQLSNDAVTAIKDDSQEDGWLNNGDLADGSQWYVVADKEAYLDTSYFYARDVTVIRFIYVPGNDLSKAGLTSEGLGWGVDAKVILDRSELIKTVSEYNPSQLGGNRLKAYNKAVNMILNTKDATADTVEEARQNLINATDSATGITLPDESVSIYAGESYEVKPVLEPLGSTDKLTWKSSDESVATVSDEGVVKGISAGNATITVTAENPDVKAELAVTVSDVDGISLTALTGTEVEAQSGELQFLASVDPSDWDGNIKWSVSDSSIATVTEESTNKLMATVKGLKEGKVTLTAKIGSKEASQEITIKEYQGPYVYFEYADGRKQLLDDNDTITLTCLDEGKFVVGRSSGTTTWSGGSDFVTSIQGGDDLQYWTFINKETGKWNPWDTRKLTITVDSGGWSKTFTVNCVSSGITELKTYVGDKEVSLDNPYESEGLVSGVGVTVKGRKADSDEWITIPKQALNYDTSDTKYNIRWQGNQLVFTAGGQATMSVFMRDNWNVKAQFIAKCNYVPLTGFTIETPETFTITGEKDFMTGNYYGLGLYTDNLKITYTPSNATNRNLNWEALTPDIATFTTEHNAGIVPKKCGTAKFKVTSSDNPDLVQYVTVKFLYNKPLQKAELETTEYEMKVGDTQALNITTTPSDATEKGFKYTYDNEGIVEVKDGKIVAKKAGTVKVTGTPLDDTQGCNNIEFTVTVTGDIVEQDDPTATIKAAIEHGLNYISTQSMSKYGDEWNIFTTLRAGGTISEENRASYLESTEKAVQEGLSQPTDYARVILTLGVMGEDPTNFGGVNLIEKLYNWKGLDELTSNQISWILIALDSKDYEIPADARWSREDLVQMCLEFQDESGGFMLTGTPDVDMTGMIMQALAPYNNDEHQDVQEAFTKALTWLQGKMTTEAGFAENSSSNENSCTTAQILTALSVAGIDPLDGNNGFTIGKKNMVTNLWGYKADQGFYWDKTVDTKGNAMGTQQTTYAFEAYRRYRVNENSLYDLTDVPTKVDKVTVKFDADNGEDIITKEVSKGQTLDSVPQAPTKDGYTFVGWYTDTDDTTTGLKTDATYDQDVTYKAKYAHVQMLGAQGRLVVDGKSGIRFGTKLYDDGDKIVEKGTLILPANLLAEGETLTLSTPKVAKSIAKSIYEVNEKENYVTYLGTIVNIPEAQFDRQITASSYVTYQDKAGNEYTVYSPYANGSTSVNDILGKTAE